MMHRKTSIENHLRNALEGDEIYMVFQPQVAADGSLYGAEALIRWENEALGTVPPAQFISIAEEVGLMSSLGPLILQRTCFEFSQIIEKAGKVAENLSLSINISVKHPLPQPGGPYKTKDKSLRIKVRKSIRVSGFKTISTSILGLYLSIHIKDLLTCDI